MRYRSRFRATLLLSTFALICHAVPALGQGSGSSRATPTPPRQPTPQEFAANMWRYINRDKAPFSHWAMAEPTSSESNEDPHGTGGKTYFNDVAEKDRQALGYGSIIVREEYGDDPKEPLSVSVMYRAKGTDPKNNDWYWLKFLPNGTVAKTPPEASGRPIIGRVASCIECHKKAVGADLVFSNDVVPDGGQK